MWAPIQTSANDNSANWVQVGTRAPGMCDKHTQYDEVNTPGSWMATNEDVGTKKVYACCPGKVSICDAIMGMFFYCPLTEFWA